MRNRSRASPSNLSKQPQSIDLRSSEGLDRTIELVFRGIGGIPQKLFTVGASPWFPNLENHYAVQVVIWRNPATVSTGRLWLILESVRLATGVVGIVGSIGIAAGRHGGVVCFEVDES